MEKNQLKDAQQNIKQNFNFVLQTQIKPYNELADLFNAYIAITDRHIAELEAKIVELQKKLDTKK